MFRQAHFIFNNMSYVTPGQEEGSQHPSNSKPSLKMCPTCFKYQKIRYYPIHLKICTKTTPYQCKICNKSYLHKSRFLEHKSLKHNDTDIQIETKFCQYCSKTFQLHDSYRKHMKLHSDNSFPCNYLNCKKTFTELVNLNRHKKLCHGIKKKCSKCERSFANPGNLQRHIKIIHFIMTLCHLQMTM